MLWCLRRPSQRFLDAGQSAFVLDGDLLRRGLNRDLDFSPAHRSENVRRIAEVAKLMNAAGLTVICSLISPYRNDREIACAIIGPEHFIEVHISTSLAECERRDPKGLYRRARAGELPDFTGVTAPYEVPLAPAVSLDTSRLTVEECVDRISKLVLPSYKAVKKKASNQVSMPSV